MHSVQRTPLSACPSWCTTEHDATEPHDSEPVAVPATGRTCTLFVRLTQRGQAPAQIEVQDDTGTVARLSYSAAGALVRAINSLVLR